MKSHFIEETIGKVLRQLFMDSEVILVENSSTDVFLGGAYE